jgi:hypothetical protein
MTIKTPFRFTGQKVRVLSDVVSGFSRTVSECLSYASELPEGQVSEAIKETRAGAQHPVESFTKPDHPFGSDADSSRDVPLCSHSSVEQLDRLGPVDPKRRVVNIDASALQG